MDSDTNARLGDWQSVSDFLSLSSNLYDFLRGPGRSLLQRYTNGSVTVPKNWTLDEMFFCVEGWNGKHAYLCLSLDPLGTYLRDARPCVWVIAGIWDLEALGKHVGEGRTFGSHIYFSWNTADGNWAHAMHPVGQAEKLWPRLRELEKEGHEVEKESVQFMDYLPVTGTDLEPLEAQVGASLERAAAILGIKPTR